jgi:hypothetical protein
LSPFAGKRTICHSFIRDVLGRGVRGLVIGRSRVGDLGPICGRPMASPAWR